MTNKNIYMSLGGLDPALIVQRQPIRGRLLLIQILIIGHVLPSQPYPGIHHRIQNIRNQIAKQRHCCQKR